MSFLTNLDTRWIYVLFIIGTIVPLISPMGLPISVSPDTMLVYETIENIPDGSIIFYGPDMGMGNRGETQAMMVASLKHLFSKDVKIVSASFYAADSPIMFEQAIAEVGLENYGKVYGVDIVNLGYYDGREATIVAFGADAHEFLTVDYYGTPIAEIPIMDEFSGADDLDLVFSITGGEIFPEVYLRQWQTQYKLEVTGGAVAMIYPILKGYVASGQISGLLASSRGAAEYELMLGEPGSAIVAMDSQSIGHIITILAIVISNVGSWMSSKEVST